VEQLEDEFKGIENIILVSAKERTNLDALRNSLMQRFRTGEIASGDTIVTNARHAAELKQTDEALSRVEQGLATNVTNDFIAGDLRYALHHLGMITGEISNEDLLDTIFSKFCIGK